MPGQKALSSRGIHPVHVVRHIGVDDDEFSIRVAGIRQHSVDGVDVTCPFSSGQGVGGFAVGHSGERIVVEPIPGLVGVPGMGIKGLAWDLLCRRLVECD